jgi:predicted TIM-barrel fold metal-dependent hydrolase
MSAALRIGACVLALSAVVLLLGRQWLFHGPYQPPQAVPEEPIVDLHCHAAGIGAGNSGCSVSPALRANFRFRIYLDAYGVTEAELQQYGDGLLLDRIAARLHESRHVDAAVVLALDGVIDAEGRLDPHRTEVFVPNAFVAAGVARHTNLLFGASINPYRTNALAELDRVAADGAVLVKWIPSVMRIDPADPGLIPFYDRMRQHQLPLLSHTGSERSFTAAIDELADPARLRVPLERGVTVIAAHAGAGGENRGRRDFDQLREMMREFPRLYADLSALTQVNRLGRLREALADPTVRDRLVYGSDYPLINTALVSPWYYPLNLTDRQRQEIAAIENPWDRDLLLKQALGVPADVIARGPGLLRRPPPRSDGSRLRGWDQSPAATNAFWSGESNSDGAQPATTTTSAANTIVASASPPAGHAAAEPRGSSTNTAFSTRR